MIGGSAALTVLLVLGLLIVIYGVRIINQYERGVVFRLGKVRPMVKEPGLRLIIPVIDQIRKVDMRIVTLPVDSQKIISRDNVSIDVAAVAYFQIVDPIKSVVEIENVVAATYQIAQTTVRNVVGQSPLDEVLSDTQKLNEAIKGILDVATERWGVYVSAVELKDIQLPDTMQRAMAKQAEAEREKRAKIIAAEGEQLSAAKLGEAADIIAEHPIALQLRNLQTLSEIATEKNSTIIFPSQFMDTVKSLKSFMSEESNIRGPRPPMPQL
jgi:regulator of protease activity HflC (stomatin/prohibitin superfamily)